MSPFPVLWIAAIACMFLLLRDSTFDRRLFWNIAGARAGLIGVLVRVVVCGALLLLVAWLVFPERLFEFPRRNPGFWAIVMVGYPVLSVLPQGIVFRNWFVHRYRGVLGEGATMILVASIAFGFAHIFFGNWVAPLITFAGGLLFTRTYLRQRSGLLADIEHALLGDVVFTIGFGSWLYSGTN